MRTQVETIIDVQLNNRNRATVFFRGILAFPMAIFVTSFAPLMHAGWTFGGIIVIPVILSLVFRQAYPSYALKFNHSIFELNTRLTAYVLFLNDEYPSIEANEKVAILLPDVEGGRKLNRWLPLVKWILALPLYLVGFLYIVAALTASVIAWFSILFTGTYPRWAVDFVMGMISFWNRVIGYCAILVTDHYPSFSI